MILAACTSGKHDSVDQISKVENTRIEAPVYTCPMHPQIIKEKPGECPVCGMDLVKKVPNAAALKSGAVSSLSQSSSIVSPIPVTTLEQVNDHPDIEVTGEVEYDTRLTGTISARVSGRIDKLLLRFNYQDIMKGQKVMEIYSPELLTAEQNLLFILKNDAGNASLISAAKQRLLLSGVSAQQLQQVINSSKPSYAISVYSTYNGHVHDIEPMNSNATVPGSPTNYTTRELTLKEGMYVQKGQPLFSVYNPARLRAILYITEGQQLVKTGAHVSLVSEVHPELKIQGRIDYIEPLFRKDSKTLSARVYFDNSRLHIPVGSHLKGIITTAGMNYNVLPKQAIISLGADKVVFLKTSTGFRSHKVETGVDLKDKVQIIKGLSPGDSVAINAQYLVDSESFIKLNKE